LQKRIAFREEILGHGGMVGVRENTQPFPCQNVS
jgi:hypothetical protein